MRSGALISWIALLSLAGTVAADDNSEVLRETLSAAFPSLGITRIQAKTVFCYSVVSPPCSLGDARRSVKTARASSSATKAERRPRFEARRWIPRAGPSPALGWMCGRLRPTALARTNPE